MRLTDGADASTKKYMVDGIRYVCDNFKDRAPGTHSERKAQKYLASELNKWADNVKMEDFEVHPYAFLGWIPAAGLVCVLSVIFYWLTIRGIVINCSLAVISTILTLIATLCFVFEFLMYREFVDFLFPKKTSRNVFACRKPSGEVKRRIIFGGHTDATNEWTYTLHGGLKSMGAVMGGSIGGMLFLTVFNFIWMFYSFGAAPYQSKIWIVIGVIEIVLVPFFIAIMFFVNWGLIVDGANDNLTADFIAMGVLKDMADKNERFENTEVCALLSGSEEAGLRGAVAYAKRHKDDLSDVETIFVAMDTMREVEQLQVYTSGCTGTQKDSNAVGELLYEAGENCGIDMPETELYPGAIDSEGFSRYGLTAAGFCGVNHDPKTYYHTRLDTPDNISEECINLSLDICIEAAKLYDEKGSIDAFRQAGSERFKHGHNN